jgi:hypothetical protein
MWVPRAVFNAAHSMRPTSGMASAIAEIASPLPLGVVSDPLQSVVRLRSVGRSMNIIAGRGRSAPSSLSGPLATSSSANLRLGSFYALATTALLGTQEPFSALAAKHLSPLYFVCLTQAALLLSVPLLTARRASRHDFVVLLPARRNRIKLAVLFVIGCSGLALYNLGLRNAHPIIIAAILNLSPFWAALVARVVSRKPIPTSPFLFADVSLSPSLALC